MRYSYKTLTRSCAVVMLIMCAVLMAGCGCSRETKTEQNPIPTPAQQVVNQQQAEQQAAQQGAAAQPGQEQPQEAQAPAGPGDPYIEALSPTDRVAAAASAETYIKEKTKNHLNRLVLNPQSDFWAFPEDLNEFNKKGQIIVFDAYCDNKTDQPYRVVLIKSSAKSESWSVKRFGLKNSAATSGAKSDSKSDSKSSSSKNESQSSKKSQTSSKNSDSKSSSKKSSSSSSNSSSSKKSDSDSKSKSKNN